MSFLIELFSSFLFVSFSTFIIGRGVLFFSRNKFIQELDFYGKISFTLLIGFLTISSLTAIISTLGATIMWLVLLPCLLFCYPILDKGLYIGGQKFTFRFSLVNILLIGSVALLAFFFVYYFGGSPQNEASIHVHDDYYYYAKLAESLIDFGTESPMALIGDYVDVSESGLYHFGDLWFSSLYVKLLNLSGVGILYFITYPLLILIGVLGFLSCFSTTKWNNKLVPLLLITLILFGGAIRLEVDYSWFKAAKLWYAGSFGLDTRSLKTVVIFAVLPFLLKSIQDRKSFLLILCCLILAGCYITILPAMMGIMMSYLAYEFIILSKTKGMRAWKELLPTIITAIIGIGYLLAFKATTTEKYTYEPHLFEITKKDALIASIEYCIYPFLVFGFITLCIPFLAKKWKLNLMRIMFVFSGGIVASVCFIMLNFFKDNVNQILINFMVPGGFALTCFLIAQVQFKKVYLVGVVVLLGVSGFVNLEKHNSLQAQAFPEKQYSVAFKIEVLDHFSSEKNRWVTLRHSPWWMWFYVMDSPGEFIMNKKGTSYPLDISRRTHGKVIVLHETSPYYTPGFSMDDFLIEKDVHFLYAEDSTLIPNDLKNITELLAHDSISGHYFYAVKKGD